MAEIDDAFYKLTVAQRDHAWTESARRLERIATLKAQLAEKDARLERLYKDIGDIGREAGLWGARVAEVERQLVDAERLLGRALDERDEKDRQIERLTDAIETVLEASCYGCASSGRDGQHWHVCVAVREHIAATTTPPLTFPEISLEALSARLHDIYQVEAHRRGDIRHHDAYDDLTEDVKEWDRVLARWILANWAPLFDPEAGLPPATQEAP